MKKRLSPADERSHELRGGLKQKIWRPRAFGYLLLAFGLGCVLMLGGAARQGEIWMLFSLGAFGVAALGVGLALIRKANVARSLRG